MVRDGLVVWLDGKDNTNTGTYDENASTWINKMNPSYNWNLYNSFWQENGVHFNGNLSGMRLNNINPFAYNKMTFEIQIMFNNLELDRIQWIMGIQPHNNYEGNVSFYLYEKKFWFKIAIGGTWHYLSSNSIELLNDKKYLITATIKGGEINLYIDGQLIQSENAIQGSPSFGERFVLGDYSRYNGYYGNNGFVGNIYDFKVYNKCLTQEEIDENYYYYIYHGNPPAKEDIPGANNYLISRIQNKNQVYNIKDTVARVEKIDKYENSTVTGIVDFYNGLQIQGAYVRYDQETNTIIFE